MNPEIHRIVTGEGLWLKEAPDRGVRFNMAQGNHASVDAYGEILAPEPRTVTFVNHQAAHSITNAPALPFGGATGQLPGSKHGFDVDPLWVLAREERIVRRRSTSEVDGERESIATEGVAHQEVVRPQDVKTMGLRP